MPLRPSHPHQDVAPVEPGRIYQAAVELWPTSIVVPPGYRLGLSIRGRDYQYEEDAAVRGITASAMNGSGWCIHDDPADRDPATLTGQVTVHTGAGQQSYLLVPVIPG